MKLKKIVLTILLVGWMIIVFMFSSQQSENSSQTSEGAIVFILDKLSITDNMTENEKEQMIENLQTPIRKLAHFSIYTIGGIISYCMVSQYNLKLHQKVLVSLGICIIYAITDELHQYFVPGRSCEIIDMMIDSLGATLGNSICIILSNVKRLLQLNQKYVKE